MNTAIVQGIYGVCHLSYLDFFYLCQSQNLNFGVVTALGINRQVIGQQVRPYPLFCSSWALFQKVQHHLRHPCCIYLYDSPFLLLDWQIPLLGTSTSVDKTQFDFSPITSEAFLRTLVEPNRVQPKYKPLPVFKNILDLASSKSQLSTIQTLLYKITDSSLRGWIQTCFYDWLFGELSKADLIDSLDVLPSALQSRIIEEINLPNYLILRKAIALVIRQKLTAEEAAAQFKAPIYDIRYVVQRHKKLNTD